MTDRPDTRAEHAADRWIATAYGYRDATAHRDLVTTVAPALIGDHLRALAANYRRLSGHPAAPAIVEALELAACDVDPHGEPRLAAGAGFVLPDADADRSVTELFAAAFPKGV